jgi:hypothetical protein
MGRVPLLISTKRVRKGRDYKDKLKIEVVV